MLSKVALAACLSTVGAQLADSNPNTEQHPKLTWERTTNKGKPTVVKGTVVIDQNWRWVKPTGTTDNCFKGNQWNQSVCTDPVDCAKTCELAGANIEYNNTYGVHSLNENKELKIDFVTNGPYSRNVGARVFMLEEGSEDKYEMFKLKNREFTFDTNVSNLPCGLNGALYFVNMDQDGGMAKYPTNKAGAKYGTGYCDAQCPHDIKFIDGQANIGNWTPTGNDTGVGRMGSCCVELDIWEANDHSAVYTTHACEPVYQQSCEYGEKCGDGDFRFKGPCDKNGCDLQPYRWNDTTFFGRGLDFNLDSTKPITVVTQFITSDGTDAGDLVEIRRHYWQEGNQIASPTVTKEYDSLNEGFCKHQVDTFQDNTNFIEKGGFKKMSEAMDLGMVLVLSLWDDHEVSMIWLDASDPPNGTGPGVKRGTCSQDSGNYSIVEKLHPNSTVTFSNIRFGEIGSTDGLGPLPPTPPAPAPPGPPAPSTTTTPSGSCPGGSLVKCIELCPKQPATVFTACTTACGDECGSSILV